MDTKTIITGVTATALIAISGVVVSELSDKEEDARIEAYLVETKIEADKILGDPITHAEIMHAEKILTKEANQDLARVLKDISTDLAKGQVKANNVPLVEKWFNDLSTRETYHGDLSSIYLEELKQRLK